MSILPRYYFSSLLKVQMRRRPVPVVVVESFDEQPSDN